MGWEDPLEKGEATHSSILAADSHGQRNLEGYSCKKSDMTEQLFIFTISMNQNWPGPGKLGCINWEHRLPQERTEYPKQGTGASNPWA